MSGCVWQLLLNQHDDDDDDLVNCFLQQTIEAWRMVFYLGAAIYVLGTVIYCIFGSGEVQPWAIEKSPEEEGLNEASKEALEKEKEVEKEKGENIA